MSFEKTNSLLKKQKDPILLFWSQDLKENNQYFQYISNRFDISDVIPSRNGVYKLINENQTIFILFPTHIHSDV